MKWVCGYMYCDVCGNWANACKCGVVRGGGKTQAMLSLGVPMMLANGVVKPAMVGETKNAGCASALSHARDTRVGEGVQTCNDGVCSSETHTTTHTDDATTCEHDTCDGVRWLHEPEATK
jgi:hypothetical protein